MQIKYYNVLILILGLIFSLIFNLELSYDALVYRGVYSSIAIDGQSILSIDLDLNAMSFINFYSFLIPIDLFYFLAVFVLSLFNPLFIHFLINCLILFLFSLCVEDNRKVFLLLLIVLWPELFLAFAVGSRSLLGSAILCYFLFYKKRVLGALLSIGFHSSNIIILSFFFPILLFLGIIFFKSSISFFGNDIITILWHKLWLQENYLQLNIYRFILVQILSIVVLINKNVELRFKIAILLFCLVLFVFRFFEISEIRMVQSLMPILLILLVRHLKIRTSINLIIIFSLITFRYLLSYV